MHPVDFPIVDPTQLKPARFPDFIGKAICYPTLAGAKTSINYTAKINGRPVYVDHHSGFAGGDISWVAFDLNGTVEVAITALRNVAEVEVCPKSAGVVAELVDNTATLRISRPCRIFLRWDDSFELPFHIFANPIEKDTPRDGQLGVHYFGAGEHTPGIINVESNETVYLAPGAVVHGVIQAKNAHHVTIQGRGTLCTSHLSRNSKETYQTGSCPHEAVGFRNCTDIKIDGITILDSHHWTVVFWDCERVNVSNLKLFGERNFSTDGINPVNCRDVLIEDCFARCKDDCISIKGLDGRYPNNASPIRNIVVQNCVFWSDNNNALVVGSETKACEISDIVFRNIDLVRVSNTCGDYAGALSIICLHDTNIHDITFEDIRIEHCTGPYFNFFFCDSIFGILGSRQPSGGTFKNIVLKNITISKSPMRKSYISGYDSDRLIENVRIENLSIGGKIVKNALEGSVVANDFTRDVRFVNNL